MKISETKAWHELTQHSKVIKPMHLRDLFLQDNTRFDKFSLDFEGILYDYSKQLITDETKNLLIRLAETARLRHKMHEFFSGKKINLTEDKPVLHMKLRSKTDEAVKQVLEKMYVFAHALRSGEYLGVTGKPITDIISLGIGGSDLGPLMVCRALRKYKNTNIEMHFISNTDSETLDYYLKKLDPEQTLCIVNSKSFTTLETMLNADVFRTWFIDALGMEGIQHMFAVTVKTEAALEFGVIRNNIFAFWHWVGGRFSVWSAVGLPIAISLGVEGFQEFLDGANRMDEHFLNTDDFSKNIPIMMALIGIWNINFLGYQTLAILPYLDALEYFPSYLQQLEMESNGKSAHHDLKTFVDYNTAPIIWGGVGCNCQHAYMQLLHQGTIISPVDFIVPVNVTGSYKLQHQVLIASCLGQSEAMMRGREAASQGSQTAIDLTTSKTFNGNRPSSTLMLANLDPFTLGALIALYEHKVFAQGMIWQILSFDQWGVEFGKELIKEILPYANLGIDEAEKEIKNNSTLGLLRYYYNNLDT